MDYALGQGRTEHTVGEIFRRWGSVYSQTHRVTPEQRRALENLSVCRTAALGGHMDECPDCDYEIPSYNSCHDRNCPTCNGIHARQWLEKRKTELLSVDYYHCVFTLPDTFNPIVFAAPVIFYSILFQAVWGTLKALFDKAGYGLPGVLAALHSWGSNMWLHPHIHCVVTGGGLAADEKHWNHCPEGWLLDVYELSREFRKRFLRLLKRRRSEAGLGRLLQTPVSGHRTGRVLPRPVRLPHRHRQQAHSGCQRRKSGHRLQELP